MGTVIIAGCLILLVGGIIRKMVKDKEEGKNCCCGDCGKCGCCHH